MASGSGPGQDAVSGRTQAPPERGVHVEELPLQRRGGALEHDLYARIGVASCGGRLHGKREHPRGKRATRSGPYMQVVATGHHRGGRGPGRTAWAGPAAASEGQGAAHHDTSGKEPQGRPSGDVLLEVDIGRPHMAHAAAAKGWTQRRESSPNAASSWKTLLRYAALAC